MGKHTLIETIGEQWTRLPPPLQSDLSNKTIIVTGANTGIGFEAAKTFAKQHPKKLIIACRNEEKGKAALASIEQETGYKAELGLLDQGDFASVISFAEQFKSEPLDILVANAGVAVRQYEATKDGWESTLQVNHLATALLSLLLLPTLIRTGQSKGTVSRLVIVSSDTHYWTKFDEEILDSPNILRKLNDPQYCTSEVMMHRYPDSKLLNVFFSRALADRLPVTLPLVPNTVNPGYCYSELRRHAVKSYALWLRFTIMDRLFGRTAEQGARQLVWAALGPDGREGKHAYFMRGAYVSTLCMKEPSDFAISKEGKEAQDRVWDETIEILSKVSPDVEKCVKAYLTASLP